MSGTSASVPAGAFVAGLCTVTFRSRPVGEVAELAAAAGLSVIEWGGDVHVPPGDEAAAAAARAATDRSGLAVCSYGSYLFCDEHVGASLDAVLDTAEALGAPLVRVWAPLGVEPGAPADAVAPVAHALDGVATAAAERGLDVYLEFHGGTLTATATSAVALVEAVGAPNLRCAWQPPYWEPRTAVEEGDDLDLLGPRLGPLHVYAWSGSGTRLPLATEADRWHRRLAAAARHPLVGAPRAALLEFVADDEPANLAAEARTLLGWIGAGTREAAR